MKKTIQPFTPDDPRLTAYAHGELHDPAEKAALEARLAEDAALRQALEEIRALNALLSDGFAKDLKAAATTSTVPNVVRFRLPPEDAAQKAHTARRHKLVLIATALAACIALAITVFVSPSPRQATDSLALNKDGEELHEVATVSTNTAKSGPSVTAALEIELIDAVEAEERRNHGMVANARIVDETSEATTINSLPVEEPMVSDEEPMVLPDWVPTSVSQTPIPSNDQSTPIEVAQITDSPFAIEVVTEEQSQDTVEPPEPAVVSNYSPIEDDVIVLPQFDIAPALDLYCNPSVNSASLGSKKEISRIAYLAEKTSLASKSTRLYQKYNHRTTSHDTIVDNPFRSVKDEALSTFSIDVDTAAYAQVRTYVEYGELPPKGAVRIEELINYFEYDYAPPTTRLEPFAVHLDAMDAPWAREHKLVRIALKGYEIPWEERPASNLVFLVDVSGSMDEPNKLPLVQEALAHLVKRLDRRDRVAIVTYAGEAGLALPSTTADNRETILHALENLEAGGSTQGSAGIKLAYELARKHFKKEGTNRVFLCTDGDFNVGITNRSELVSLIEEEAKSGVFLSVIGFGMGNFKDDMLEELSNKGNGNYAYIDSRQEAHRVFRQQISGTLITIAKDVKIQVEFNPAYVASYRLIGYENRQLNKEDFNDDTKDAGEIGAGHTVTALYEIIPAGEKAEKPAVDPLKYQTAPELADAAKESGEYLTVKLRYKEPEGSESKLIQTVLTERAVRTGKPDSDFRFAASVAAFGMLLRESPHAGDASFDKVYQWASDSAQTSNDSTRAEFLELIKAANSLSKQEG